MKKSLLLSILALFISFAGLQAATFNVTQNVVFKTGSCTNPPSYNGQYGSWLAQATVNVSHDIDGLSVGSPSLANTINYDCWRYIYFDIYEETLPGNYTFEGSVYKYDRWLKGAAYDYGSSSTTYQLFASDLQAAGISAGKKQIRIRVYYNYFGQTPHVINVFTQRTGTTYCSKYNAESSNFSCNLGTHRCINWTPCNGSAGSTGYISLEPIYDLFGNIVDYNLSYNYNANVTGGSGNYLYSWTLNGSVISSSSSISFTWSGSGNPNVTLTVTDITTGCVYTWSNKTAPPLETRVTGDLSLRAYPNPSAAGETIELEYLAPQEDQVGIAVFDLSGRKIADVNVPATAVPGLHQAAIESGLPRGTYFVRITSERSGSGTSKIIVQ